MLKKISVRRNVKINGKNYIKKDDVLHTDRDKMIYNQALEYATNIVREANQQTEKIKNEAFSRGYFDGLKLSLNAVVQFMTSVYEKSQSYSKECYEQLELSLKETLEDQTVFCLLLNRWCEKQKNKDNDIYLFLPSLMQCNEENILASVCPKWNGTVEISYHENLRYIIKSGDWMAEFVPNEHVREYMYKIKNIPDTYLTKIKENSKEQIKDIIHHLDEMSGLN